MFHRDDLNGEGRHGFTAADYANDGKRHLLLAASGSVATIKIPNIVQALSRHCDLSIRLIFTNAAAKFLENQSTEQRSIAALRAFPSVETTYQDEDEWSSFWVRGASILHIELRRWSKQVALIEDDWGVASQKGGWVEVLRPIEKLLACGDWGRRCDGVARHC